MIDIHTHILFGVDDGASGIDISLELIGQGLNEGISSFFLTPHLNYFDQLQNKKIVCNFNELSAKTALLYPDVRLFLGGEIHFTYDLFRFADQRIGLFGSGNSCMLLEFPFEQFPFSAYQVVDKLRKNGVVVIIAHPERIYPLADDFRALAKLRQSGCLFQITAGSLNGMFGRDVEKSAWRLLEDGFADFVASDVHHPVRRPFGMHKSYNLVASRYGTEKADSLFFKNQQKFILGAEIV